MNIDLTTVMLDIDGKLLKKGKDDLTLKTVIISALLQLSVDEKNLSIDEKLKRYDLALRIQKSDAISLESDDIVLIKKLVNKIYGTIIVGQVCNILEGRGTGLIEETAKIRLPSTLIEERDKVN